MNESMFHQLEPEVTKPVVYVPGIYTASERAVISPPWANQENILLLHPSSKASHPQGADPRFPAFFPPFFYFLDILLG